MITPMTAVRISQKTNGRCFYCNKPPEEIDHFISRYWWREWGLEKPPASLGTADVIENLFLSCADCNGKKSSKHPEDFIGNTHKAWDRYFRANRRIGVEKHINSTYTKEPFNHYNWIEFIEKYG